VVSSEDVLLAGRYRVLRKLGSGGMATVFLCCDERLEREVAVKRLHSDGPETTAQRFEREAKLGASLNHPNLVAVYDTVVDEESVLIVMEYVEGPTLAQELRSGLLAPARAVSVIAGVAEGLDHAHEAGVVHRDVKPANILLGPRGNAKLADLGIATAAQSTRITRSGNVLGTPAYMAPEQFEGAELSPAVDVYALSAIAFEALTGRKPRSDGTPAEIALRAASEPPPDLREAMPDAPPAAAEALRRGMARDPDERPRRLGELAEALEESFNAPPAGTVGLADDTVPLTTEPRSPQPVSRSPRPADVGRHQSGLTSRSGRVSHQSRTGRPRWLIAGVVAAGLVAVVVALASGGDEPNEASPERADRERPAAADGGPSSGGPPPAAGVSKSSEDATGGQGGEAQGGGGEGERLNRQGFELMNRGRYGEAVPVLRRAVDAFPSGSTQLEYAFALYNLGRSLRLSGRPGEAVPILEQRLRFPNQRATVERELEAARSAAD
jgi:serine/threonine-protein kinase